MVEYDGGLVDVDEVAAVGDDDKLPACGQFGPSPLTLLPDILQVRCARGIDTESLHIEVHMVRCGEDHDRHRTERADRGDLGERPGKVDSFRIVVRVRARSAVQKHVEVLVFAGLVSKHRSGREQLVRGEVNQLRRAYELLDELKTLWRARLERFEDILNQTTGKEIE